MAISLETLKQLNGFLAAAVVDSGSGMMLDSAVAGNFPIEVAAAANTEVVQAKLRAMEELGMGNEAIEDMLITLGTQYHLIRPLTVKREIFVYLALDRSKANLALARLALKTLDEGVKKL